jgi:hypothetical protein
MYGSGVGRGKPVMLPRVSPDLPDLNQVVAEFTEVEAGLAKQNIAEYLQEDLTILNTKIPASVFV